MGIYRGIGGTGDSTTDATITAVTEQATNAANSATAAASSASSASTSATNAATSETNAATSETNAASSATAAASSATSAASSASSASTSASNAATSETNAASSATNAATSASNASTSETNAATSATAAASSATSASTSASNAATSASNASTSETNAASSATAAAASATAAASSATSASTSATNAATSETNAATSATNAASSATAAAASASAASTSASNASTSETNAASSATAAATSASNASTSASNASTSETNAASSASSASTSASNAATSATAASNAQTAAETAQAAAEAAQEAIDGLYLGAQASDPTLDNNGDAVTAGDWYYNTTTNVTRIYDGSTWQNGAVSTAGFLLAGNNLSDLGSAATARTNLGVAIGADVQAYSSVLAATTASFTTADETKLDGIETGATADQTAQEIATAIDADATAETTLKSALGLGTAAYTSSSSYATAAQGLLANSAVQPNDNLSDSDYIAFGGSSDSKLFYDGANNTMEMELEADVQGFIITNNGTTRFIFDKASGDFTAIGEVTGSNLNIIDWDTAYGWGNHASAGYVTPSSTDTFTNKSGNISQWTNDSGYLTSTMAGRNRIINGAMMIDQRNAGASVTPTNGQFSVDRWKSRLSVTSKYSVQQSSTAPTGFNNSLLITSLSAYTVGASELFVQEQVIEGFNVSDLGWGTANAKTVTLSFWVRSSLTGTFGGSFSNSARNRSYPFSYAINSADTWEQKTITVAGDTTGTWLTDSGKGIEVCFSLGSGATYSGTAGSWAGADYRSATGATSVVGTSGATFYITGVQLEVGSSASEFEHRLYPQELALCQRYFFKTTQTVYGADYGSNSFTRHNFPVEMRATPTVTGTNNKTVISTYHSTQSIQYYLSGNASALILGATAEAEL